MKVLTMIVAAALAAGLTAAHAQSTMSPGSPGQSQPNAGMSTGTGASGGFVHPTRRHASRNRTRHSTASGRMSAPYGTSTTTGAGGQTNTMDRSVGDRNSRGTTKNAPGGQ